MLLTPPPSSSKQGFFKSVYTRSLPYYEDVYGKHNEDEGAEGAAEVCESESDSDDIVPLSQYEKGKGKQSATKETYKIAPNLEPKRSLPRADYDRLKPRKFGMFGSRRPTLDEMEDDFREAVPSVEDADDENSEPLRARSNNSIDEDESDSDEEDNGLRSPSPRRTVPMRRPASRKLIKHELAEKTLKDKAARRVEKSTKKKTGTKTAEPKPFKAIKKTGRIGSKSSKPAAQSSRTAFVMVDNRRINVDEYQRFED